MIVNITTRSDSDFVRSFVYQTIAAVPINLTGSTLEMMARVDAGDVTAALDLSTANGAIVITDAVNGKFTLTIPVAQLSKLAANNYDHSLIRHRTDLILEEVWHGTLSHTVGPTR